MIPTRTGPWPNRSRSAAPARPGTSSAPGLPPPAVDAGVVLSGSIIAPLLIIWASSLRRRVPVSGLPGEITREDGLQVEHPLGAWHGRLMSSRDRCNEISE